jgi:hypothetical protein
MFKTYAHQGVDAIQSAKKQFVSTFVQHEQFAKVLNGFVDAQAEYTKSAIDAGAKAFSDTQSILSDRTPFVEMSKKIQAYFPTAYSATPSKKAK